MIPSSLSLIFLANTSSLLPDDPVLLVLDLPRSCCSCLPPLLKTKLGPFLLSSPGRLHLSSSLRRCCTCSRSDLSEKFLQSSNSLLGDANGEHLESLSCSCLSSCLLTLGPSNFNS